MPEIVPEPPFSFSPEKKLKNCNLVSAVLLQPVSVGGNSTQKQGCQIFHGTWYQNRKKCTK
jgi:hypothetical protein